MEISPQAVASATFRTARRGYDPEEVREFLVEVSRALESAQQHAASMEARARAAVQRLQELAEAPRPGTVDVPADDAETISRTLLLAQRTADATIAEARAEADALLASARAEADGVLAEARREADREIDEARAEARRAMEAERLKVENEVQSLLARREFLLADVQHLEEFAASQRRRLQDTADLLREIAERAPGGLGEMRRPLLSAAADTGPVGAGAAETLAAQPSVPVEPKGQEPPHAPAEDGADVWERAGTRRDDLGSSPVVELGTGVTADTSEAGGSVDPAPNPFAQAPVEQASLVDFDDITAEIPTVPSDDAPIEADDDRF